MTIDVNSRACYLDPYAGGALTVVEAARNLSCVGARPLAITDCLNFGNPEREPIAYQFEQAIRGMADACRALNIPVISGNVSLYNESADGPIDPTPTVGMVGLLDDLEARCGAGFVNEGHSIVLIGAPTTELNVNALGASEYLSRVHGTIAGRPDLDIAAEAQVQALVREAIGRGLLRSAHDVSEGGLAVAVAESCAIGGIGAALEIGLTENARIDATLFGEPPARIVVSTAVHELDALRELCERNGVAMCEIGTVRGDWLRIGDLIDVPLADVSTSWEGALFGA